MASPVAAVNFLAMAIPLVASRKAAVAIDFVRETPYDLMSDEKLRIAVKPLWALLTSIWSTPPEASFT